MAKQRAVFKKGDVVVSKDEFLGEKETLLSTAGIVLEYYEDNDYMLLGVLHPEKYAIAPTFPGYGSYYRLVTEQEKKAWNIVN